MSANKLSLQQLRMKHFLQKSKMRSAVYGGNFDEEFFSMRGPVSQWFSTTGFQQFRQYAELEAMSRLNSEINSLARRLQALYKGGRLEEARDGLAEVDKISEEFTRLLSQLESKV